MGRLLGASILTRPYLGPAPRKTAAPAPMLITFGGPNSNGPWNPLAGNWPYGSSNDFGAYTNTGATAGGSIYGSLDSGSGLVNGVSLEALGWDGDPGPQGVFVVVLGPAGSLTQNFFTSVTLSAPISLTLPTAGANYFDSNDPANGFAGYSVWAWVRTPIASFQQFAVSFA